MEQPNNPDTRASLIMIWTSAELSVKDIEAGRCTGVHPRKIPSGTVGPVGPKHSVSGIAPEEFIPAYENFCLNPADIMREEPELGDEFKEQLRKTFTCKAILSFAVWFWNYFNYLSFKKVEPLMKTKN